MDSSYERLWHQLECNDPALTELMLTTSSSNCDITDQISRKLVLQDIPRGDWGKLGTLIGRNKHVKMLSYEEEYLNLPEKEEVKSLFYGIACNSSIQTLKFYDCKLFDGELFSILVPLFKNNQVICLVICNCNMGHELTTSLALVLTEFESLKEFKLTDWSINNGVAVLELIQSLGAHRGLSCLSFHGIPTGICDQGVALSNLLQNPTSDLTTLELVYTNIDPAGWQAIFATLQTPTCRLQKLILDCNALSDDVFLSLSNSLANNNTVRELDCSYMENITERGWQGFIAVFASPHSALVKLHMSHDAINDATKILFVNALAGNSMLEELDILYDEFDDIPIGATTAVVVSRILCNKSSIMDTHNSNHTLTTLWDDDAYIDRLPSGIRSLLDINRMCNPSQATHVKIIMTHFSEDFDVQVFVGMDLNFIPHVIAWIGKYWRDNAVSGIYKHFAQVERDEDMETSELSMLYRVVQARRDLLD